MSDRIPLATPSGLNSDSTQFAAPGVWNNGLNVRFFQGYPQCIGGETSLQSGASEVYSKVRKLFAYKVSGVVRLAVARDLGTDVSLQTVNTTTWARSDIGPGGLSGITNYSLDMFGDVLLMVPKGNTLYESVAGAVVSTVAAAPDNITKMLVTPSRQVMALGCNEEVSATFNGRCIRWCDIEDYTDWTTTSSNNAGEYILPGQEDIVGGCLLGDYIVIWTVGSIWLGQYLGNPGQTYRFTRIDAGGLIAQDCWAILHGTVYWMSREQKFYGYRVGGNVFEVPCPIWYSLVLTNHDVASEVNFNAVAMRRFGEIWFAIGANGGTAVVFCVDESAAAGHPVWFHASGFAAAIDDPLLAGALNMADSTSIKIAVSGSTNFPLKGFDMQNGGVIPQWNIETSFFYLDEGKRRVQIQKMINDENGAYGAYTVGLKLRDYPDSSYEFASYTIPNDGEARTDMRSSGRLISVQFYDDDGSSDFFDPWRLGKPVFEIVALGNR